MARMLTTEQKSLLAARGVKKLELIQIDFDEAPLRLTTAGRNGDYGGHTWLGDGTLLAVGDVEETLELQATDWQIELSGVNPALVALAMLGQGKGRRARMWVAVLNAAGAIEGAPTLETDLRVDTMPVMDAVEG